MRCKALVILAVTQIAYRLHSIRSLEKAAGRVHSVNTFHKDVLP